MAKDPAMPFYVNDFLSSPRVAQMSLEEQGAYVRLLCYCWASGDCSLPDDPKVLAKLSGMGEGWLKNGCQMVGVCFQPHPNKTASITSPKLYELWLERQEWRAKSAAGGRKSAQKRAAKRSPKRSNVDSKGGCNLVGVCLQPKGNSSSSSSSSIIPPPTPSQSEWDAAGAAVAAEGVLAWKKSTEAARSRGLTPGQVLAIVADYRARKPRYRWDKPEGVLVAVLNAALPDTEPAWPETPLSRESKRLKASTKPPKPRPPSDLEVRHGPTLDAMSEFERERLAERFYAEASDPERAMRRYRAKPEAYREFLLARMDDEASKARA